MLRLVLGLSLAALCFADDIHTISPGVNTFYNQSAFEAVVGTFTTETFNGNQINTPGLTITRSLAITMRPIRSAIQLAVISCPALN